MRVQIGSVTAGGGGTTAERWVTELRAGRCFGLGDRVPPIAAQLGHIQLLNPAASGVNAIVYMVSVQVSVVADVVFRRYDTALTTLSGNGTNLLLGGAAGLCEVRRQTNAVALGAPVIAFTRPAANLVVFPNTWIVELGPGEGVLLNCQTVNQDMIGSFWWNEVAV